MTEYLDIPWFLRRNPEEAKKEMENSTRPQTAKKDHCCDLCLRRIPKGALYWRRVAWPDDFDTKEHTNCEDYKGWDYIGRELIVPKRPAHLKDKAAT